MNDKNQKVIRGIVIAVLAVVFAAFVVLYLTGKIGEFSGFTGETSGSSAPAAAVSVNAPAASQSVNSTPSSQSADSSGEASTPSSSLELNVSTGSGNVSSEPVIQTTTYKFRNQKLLDQHYEKHGREMGFASAEDYEKAAAAVPNHPDVLHKTEKEDGDDVYYVEATNEFVVVSTDGFIRTYFNPDRGIDYYNKQ